MVDAKFRYQVEVNGARTADNRTGTPEKALNRANQLIARGRGKDKTPGKVGWHIKVIDLANGRILGESRDGSPIRKLKA